MNDPGKTFAIIILIAVVVLGIGFIAWSSGYRDCEDHREKPLNEIPAKCLKYFR